MQRLTDYPLLLFAVTLPVMSLAVAAGIWLRARQVSRTDQTQSEDFDLIVAATLTLLGLIIGFTFSMAASRYDQRKELESAEANAIGTEYVRVEVFPAADAANLQKLLTVWTDQRILFFTRTDVAEQARIRQRTDQLEAALWKAVRAPALAQPTPISALAVMGMNEVLDARGYTQAAIWNRIPPSAWILMAAIAVISNVLIGFGWRSSRRGGLMLVLPAIVSIAFLLIADIDSPRYGLIRVHPENLISLAQSLPR